MSWILTCFVLIVLFLFVSVLVALLRSAWRRTLSSVQVGEHEVSYALAEPEATFLGRLFGAYAEKHAGASGFAIVAAGWEAFRIRYAFATLAEKTIDAQYYLWEEDVTGRILLYALIKAADRGVRVRLLLDDMHTGGEDHILALTSGHPNIQVRLYNPFGNRSVRLWDTLFDSAHITHRMHNKAFIIDNTVAIVGGRNIGDNYFSVHEQSNYRDLDLFVGGPIVPEVSKSFDMFWNSTWAFPVEAVVGDQSTSEQFRHLVAELDPTVVSYAALPFKLELDLESFTTVAQGMASRLIWGTATVIADRPDKLETSESSVLAELRKRIRDTLHQELLLEMAYLIPGHRGVKFLRDLTACGVRVRILTNSCASTDVAIVHAGYAKYRKKLLRCGVELFEMQPLAGFINREWTWLRGKSTAALHTKAAMVDRRTVLLGSFNLDPRSIYLNTELSIVVESPALAAEVARFIEEGMQPSNAYHVELDRDGDLLWAATEQGKIVHFTSEPHVSWWRCLILNSLLLLPIEEQL